MNNTINIKNIDALGRIVIPSNMRKKLEIDSNSLLSLQLDENKIILEKIQLLENNKSNEYLVEILSKMFHTEVMITDFNKVVASSDLQNQQRKISKQLLKTIEKRQRLYVDDLQIYENSNEKYDVTIFPILKSTDLYGTIVIFLKNTLNCDETINLIIKMYIENVI